MSQKHHNKDELHAKILFDSKNDPGDCSYCSCTATDNKTGKWVIFIIIIILAIVVGLLSNIKKADADQGSLVEVSGESQIETRMENFCGINLKSIHNLDAYTRNKNIAIILLPGDDKNKNMDTSNIINAFMEKISADRDDIVTFTLGKDATGHKELIQGLSIKKYPSVALLGRNGSSVVLADGVSDNKLIRAIGTAMTSSSCSTASKGGSSCCSK